MRKHHKNVVAELARIEAAHHPPDACVDTGGLPRRRRRELVDLDCPRDIVTSFAELDDYRQKFVAGAIPLLVVVGGRGLSKTYGFEEELRADLDAEFRAFEEAEARRGESDDGDEPGAGDDGRSESQAPSPPPVPDVKAKIIKGVASPVEIYKSLYLYRDKLIVIDDVDKALTQPEMVSLLKAVCNRQRDGRPNLVEWRKQNTVMEREGIKKSFYTTSHVCIIANQLPPLDPDLEGMLSRGMLVEFDPSVEEVHRFVGDWWDMKRHGDVYGWVGERLGLVPYPNIRWYTMGVDAKAAGFNWQEKLTKQWTVAEPFMADFVRVWGDPAYAQDDERYAAFSKLNGRSKSDYDRLKRRYKAIHGIMGRRRGR